MRHGTREYRVWGRVLDTTTQLGAEGLTVEAWDKDLLLDDLVGSTVTDERGEFQMRFDERHFREFFLDRQPDLYFKVFHGGRMVASTEGSVRWNVGMETTGVAIDVDLSSDEAAAPWLTVGSLDELARHEPEILQRIAAVPHGGNLFLTHPLMLLDDVGVRLSPHAREELLAAVPDLVGLSPVPYRALRATTEPQATTVVVEGLFLWGTP